MHGVLNACHDRGKGPDNHDKPDIQSCLVSEEKMAVMPELQAKPSIQPNVDHPTRIFLPRSRLTPTGRAAVT